MLKHRLFCGLKTEKKRCQTKEIPEILKNKVYLYMTEFFSGMSIMAVELGANRLLAPYFSSSQIVWTIIIGTIMIAMALGNIYGGKNVDKNPDPDKLYGRMLAAGVWIAAIPFVGKLAITGISALLVITLNTNFLIWAAFITCMVVFSFPLFLLGTVTPSLAKYATDNLDDNGKTIGMLNAFNTIGSIIGTFVPTFISIPNVGTSATFLIFAGILIILGLIYFIGSKRGLIKGIAAVVFFSVCCVISPSIGFAFWENDLAYEGESVYNYLQVKDDDRSAVLSTNVLFGVQSIYLKSVELTGMYYDYAMAGPFMSDADGTIDMLVLGMGTGTYARQCMRYFGGINVEGVEIDEKITDLAYEYFELPEDIKVTTYDGRAYLNVCDKKYDVIMVDAYQDITIPFQMSSKEFFGQVRDHLNKGGVMVVHMNMRSKNSGGINSWLSDTIASEFSEVYTIDVANSSSRELFASNDPKMFERFMRKISEIEQMDLYDFMSKISVEILKYKPGNRVLTDDKAPVELLGMEVIDDIIHDELAYYKERFKKEGIRGIIKK